MEKQKNCRFPWLIALFLCLYIALSTVAVTRLGHDAAEPAPSVPTQTTLAQPDHQGGFAQLFAQPDWVQLYAGPGSGIRNLRVLPPLQPICRIGWGTRP